MGGEMYSTVWFIVITHKNLSAERKKHKRIKGRQFFLCFTCRWNSETVDACWFGGLLSSKRILFLSSFQHYLSFNTSVSDNRWRATLGLKCFTSSSHIKDKRSQTSYKQELKADYNTVCIRNLSDRRISKQDYEWDETFDASWSLRYWHTNSPSWSLSNFKLNNLMHTQTGWNGWM